MNQLDAIIIGADANKQSFGRDNCEDFTWYGKACFDEALRRTRSFPGLSCVSKSVSATVILKRTPGNM